MATSLAGLTMCSFVGYLGIAVALVDRFMLPLMADAATCAPTALLDGRFAMLMDTVAALLLSPVVVHDGEDESIGL